MFHPRTRDRLVVANEEGGAIGKLAVRETSRQKGLMRRWHLYSLQLYASIVKAAVPYNKLRPTFPYFQWSLNFAGIYLSVAYI